MNIFTTKIDHIKLNDKLLTLTTPKGAIALDIHFLLNADPETENAYFNATDIAKLFDTKYSRVTRNEYWVETVKIIEDILKEQFCSFKSANSAPLKTDNNLSSIKGTASVPLKIKKMDKVFYNEDGTSKAIVARKGRYGGTWLHHDLAIPFMRMLNPRWGYELDQFMKTLIRHTTKMVIDRADTKTLFHPLTDSIKDKYIPNQTSKNAMSYAYPNIIDLCNRVGTGMIARVYKKNHGITDEQIKADGNISIRDYMTKDELDNIKEIEKFIHALIDILDIYDFDVIREKVEEKYSYMTS